MPEITRMVSPAPRAVWDDTLRADPAALETQSPAWTDAMCAAMGFTDASRAYEMDDGRRLVVPLLRRSVGPVRLSEGSNPLHCGVGGLLAPDGPRPDEIAAVLRDLRRRRVPVRTFWPQPVHAPRWAAAAPERAVVVERRAHLLDLEPGWGQNVRTGTRRRRRSPRTAAISSGRGPSGARSPPTPQCRGLEPSDSGTGPTERRRSGSTNCLPSAISYARLASVNPIAVHIASLQAGDCVSRAAGSLRSVSSHTVRGAGLTIRAISGIAHRNGTKRITRAQARRSVRSTTGSTAAATTTWVIR